VGFTLAPFLLLPEQIPHSFEEGSSAGASRRFFMSATHKSLQKKFERKQSSLRTTVDCKKRGELSELAFVHKAERLGFGVSKPYGESNRYDFIVHSQPNFWKVQIKSSNSVGWGGGYLIHTERRRGEKQVPYTVEEIDFLVAHIVPEDEWFIIPVRAFVPHWSVHLYPRGTAPTGRYEKYRDAWYLMM
jgi:hypothetical protein